MKTKHLTCWTTFLVVVLFTNLTQAQDLCTDFNNGSYNFWNTIYADKAIDTPGPTGNSNDRFLHTRDGSGHSIVYNSVTYGGDWEEEHLGSCICWDMRIINDGDTGESIFPSITIYNGNAYWSNNKATYTSNIPLTAADGWVQYCAPIDQCGPLGMPSDDNGSWAMASQDCDDFNDLLTDVTGIRFDIELLIDNLEEEYGFDNICIVEKRVDRCYDFENNADFLSWTSNGSISAGQPGPSGAFNDDYLEAGDGYTDTYIINATDFDGDWTIDHENECLCWDFRVVEDGSNSGDGETIAPSVTLVSGGTRATFTSFTEVGQSLQWTRTCAPLNTCNNQLPISINGSWSMNVADNCFNWNNLLSNITSVEFFVEVIDNNLSEITGFDNICFEEKPPVVADGCTEFTNSSEFDNWDPSAATTAVAAPGPSGAPDDTFLETTDGSGESYVRNSVDYDGNWTIDHENECLCWDFRVLNDGGSGATVAPSITIKRGQTTATFTAFDEIGVADGWTRTCAPLNTCNSQLPISQVGSWSMNVAESCSNWNFLLSNVTEIEFYLELIINNLSEQYGFDDICFEEKRPVDPDGCTEFTNSSEYDNWVPLAATIAVAAPGPSGAPDDTFLETTDGSGESFVRNSVDYDGNWTVDHENECLCWDFRVVNDDGTGETVAPSITIRRGQTTATFTSNNEIGVADGWTRTCAPLNTCNSQLPISQEGSWSMNVAESCNNWNFLLTNVTGVEFYIELLFNNVSEQYGFDDICFEEKPPVVADGCTEFSNSSEFDNWEATAATTDVGVPGPSGSSDDMFLETTDGSGESFVSNSVDYNGNWTVDHENECLCWDFRVVNDDGTGETVAPSINIKRGQITARFTSNTQVGVADGWVKTCAPLNTCTSQLPVSQEGSWSMNVAESCNNWNFLLSNVTEVEFYIELLFNNVSEQYGFDNICFEEKEEPVTECVDFEDFGDIANWQEVSVFKMLDAPGPSGDQTDDYLRTYDNNGISFIRNTTDFNGNWLVEHPDQNLCWDFKLVDAGNYIGNFFNPTITIFSGNVSATFTAYAEINGFSPWVRICAPINACSNQLPSNDEGFWTMNATSTCNNWNEMLSNITGIEFYLEHLGNDPKESYGIDNICFERMEEWEGDDDRDRNNRIISASSIVGNQAWVSDSIDKETDLLKGFTVYPNPSNGLFNLDFDGLETTEVLAIEVINLQGQKVHSEILDGTSTTTLNLEQLSTGIYFINVSTNEGEVFTEKVIIENR